MSAASRWSPGSERRDIRRTAARRIGPGVSTRWTGATRRGGKRLARVQWPRSRSPGTIRQRRNLRRDSRDRRRPSATSSGARSTTRTTRTGLAFGRSASPLRRRRSGARSQPEFTVAAVRVREAIADRGDRGRGVRGSCVPKPTGVITTAHVRGDAAASATTRVVMPALEDAHVGGVVHLRGRRETGPPHEAGIVGDRLRAAREPPQLRDDLRVDARDRDSATGCRAGSRPPTGRARRARSRAARNGGGRTAASRPSGRMIAARWFANIAFSKTSTIATSATQMPRSRTSERRSRPWLRPHRRDEPEHDRRDQDGVAGRQRRQQLPELGRRVSNSGPRPCGTRSTAARPAGDPTAARPRATRRRRRRPRRRRARTGAAREQPDRERDDRGDDDRFRRERARRTARP